MYHYVAYLVPSSMLLCRAVGCATFRTEIDGPHKSWVPTRWFAMRVQSASRFRSDHGEVDGALTHHGQQERPRRRGRTQLCCSHISTGARFLQQKCGFDALFLSFTVQHGARTSCSMYCTVEERNHHAQTGETSTHLSNLVDGRHRVNPQHSPAMQALYVRFTQTLPHATYGGFILGGTVLSCRWSPGFSESHDHISRR
jgi:hypothetical protein